MERTGALVGDGVRIALGEGVGVVGVESAVGDGLGVEGIALAVGVTVAVIRVAIGFAGPSTPDATSGTATKATVTIPTSAWLIGDANHHRRRSDPGFDSSSSEDARPSLIAKTTLRPPSLPIPTPLHYGWRSPESPATVWADARAEQVFALARRPIARFFGRGARVAYVHPRQPIDVRGLLAEPAIATSKFVQELMQ